jgi:hypothetical protein
VKVTRVKPVEVKLNYPKVVKRSMFNDLPNYFNQQKFILDKIKFRYLEGWYEGHGYLFWDFDKGLRIEAFVERRGKPLMGTFSDTARVTRKDEITAIYMKPRYRKWAIAPRASLHNWVMGNHREGQLSISIPNVIFASNYFQSPMDGKMYGLKSDRVTGEAFFQTSLKHRLPGSLAYEIKVGDEAHLKGVDSIAFQVSNDNFSVTGYYLMNTCIKVEFGFIKRTQQGNSYARSWLDALGLSLSFYYGETIGMLHSDFGDYKNRFTEYRKLAPVKTLGVFRPFDDVFSLVPQDVVNLANFLSRKSVEAEVSRKIFAQMVEASQQQSWTARELLLATILEAALRTLNNDPFVQGSGNSNVVSKYLSLFVKDKILDFTSDEQRKTNWKKVRRDVEKFYEKLRHRNAHPDWLTGEHGSWSHEHAKIFGAFLRLYDFGFSRL